MMNVVQSKASFHRGKITALSKFYTFRPRSISTALSRLHSVSLLPNGRAPSPLYIQQQIQNETQIYITPHLKINYVQVGIGDEPILCLCGALSTVSDTFGAILQTMDYTRFRFIVLDPPGYGKSRPPTPRDFSGEYLRRDAAVAASLMETLGFEKYSLLGHSKGGTAALCLAMDYPRNVKKLVTWGALSYLDPRFVAYLENLMKIEKWPTSRRELALSVYGERGLRDMIQNYLEATKERVEKGMYHFSDVELEEKIKCPTLVIHGLEDTTPDISHAHHLLKFLSKASTTSLLIPDAGHYPHLTHHQQFMDIVQNFLNTSKN